MKLKSKNKILCPERPGLGVKKMGFPTHWPVTLVSQICSLTCQGEMMVVPHHCDEALSPVPGTWREPRKPVTVSSVLAFRGPSIFFLI